MDGASAVWCECSVVQVRCVARFVDGASAVWCECSVERVLWMVRVRCGASFVDGASAVWCGCGVVHFLYTQVRVYAIGQVVAGHISLAHHEKVKPRDGTTHPGLPSWVLYAVLDVTCTWHGHDVCLC